MYVPKDSNVLNIGGGCNVEQNLIVQGDATFKGNVEFDGDVTFKGNVYGDFKPLPTPMPTFSQNPTETPTATPAGTRFWETNPGTRKNPGFWEKVGTGFVGTCVGTGVSVKIRASQSALLRDQGLFLFSCWRLSKHSR
jgi:hypothetical protein